MPLTISALYIYPVKSCAGIAVEALPLDALGAANDRRYMLVDEEGRFVTLRQYAQLVHVRIDPVPQGWQIAVPGNSTRILPFAGMSGQERQVTVWSDQFSAHDQGDEWAGFFSDFLGKKVRLVYAGPDTPRTIDRAYCQQDRQVSFADGFPLLLANESSLAMLNRQLPNAVAMARFRPNIVVSGAPAFAENHWQGIKTAKLAMAIVKPCSRCVIPTINPHTAQKEPAVWQALERLCKGEDGKVYFGQNVIHQAEGVLRLGDELTVC